MPENVPTARQEVSPIHFSNPDIPGPEFAFAALLAHHLLLDVWVVFVVIPKLTRQWLTTKPSTKKVYPHHPARWLCNPSDLQTTVPFALNTTVMVLCRRTSWADVKLFSMTAQMSLCWLTVNLDDLDQLMHDQLWSMLELVKPQ